MIEQSQKSIPYYRFEGLGDNGKVQHTIFSRKGGISLSPFNTLNLSVSVPDDKDKVLANRTRAYAVLNRGNDDLVHAILTHGAEVARVSHHEHGLMAIAADGLITDEPGCGLTMNYADCAPILLYDPTKQAIGLGHAGWKGVVKDLPGAMIRSMQRIFGTDPADVVAGVGPCIGPCCYEVGGQVISAVTSSFENPEELLDDSQSLNQNGSVEIRRQFDLPRANRRRLVAAGVENVEMSGLCTACRTDLFFSHRAEKGRTGRFGVMLLLTP